MFSARKTRGRNRGKHRCLYQKKRSFFRPRLEALEDRCVPATVNTWVAAGMFGNWNNAANWSQARVPNSTDIATFNNSSAAVCVIDFTVSGNTASGINITPVYLGSIFANADLVLGPDGFAQ